MSPQVVSGSLVGSRRESLRSAPSPPAPPCSGHTRNSVLEGSSRAKITSVSARNLGTSTTTRRLSPERYTCIHSRPLRIAVAAAHCTYSDSAAACANATGACVRALVKYTNTRHLPTPATGTTCLTVVQQSLMRTARKDKQISTRR